MADAELKDKVKAASVPGGFKLSDCCDDEGTKDLPEIKMPGLKKVLKGHLKKVNCATWDATSSLVASADQLGKVIIWDAKSGAKTKVCDKPFTSSVEIHPEKKFLAVGAMNNLCTIYTGIDAPGHLLEMSKELAEHDGYVSSIKFPSANEMITTGGDGKVSLWDVAKFKVTMSFYGHRGDSNCCRLARDDPAKNMFVTCSTDKTMRVWDKRTGEATHCFDLGDECNACAFFPSGMAVAAGMHGGSSQLFDLRSNSAVNKYARKGARVAALDLSASGRGLYMGYEDGHVGCWDPFASTGYKQKLDAHNKNNGGINRMISALAFSPDGTGFLTSAFDAKIKIWSVSTASDVPDK